MTNKVKKIMCGPCISFKILSTRKQRQVHIKLGKIPRVGVSKGGVRGLTDARRLFVPFLKDKQIEYPALKAQFQQKWTGTKPPSRQV